ncbi:MAG: hypothetical protein KF745_14040 [Phycisphaeraceae bacterium]|nr:hypothetical protein [Phycisphaeraceae bacterium]
MTHRTTVDTRRLFDAADQLLIAMRSESGKRFIRMCIDGGTPSSGMLRGAVFTQFELVEAMNLLIRLGLVPSRSPGGAGT